MNLTVDQAVSAFGAKAKDKLTSPAAEGQPEDQLRAPFEKLLGDVAELANFQTGAVVAVGESSHRELKTRPDYAVTVQNALVGFVELKAPGKGADPRKFKDELVDRREGITWARQEELPALRPRFLHSIARRGALSPHLLWRGMPPLAPA
jgi:hypothetical protein